MESKMGIGRRLQAGFGPSRVAYIRPDILSGVRYQIGVAGAAIA